MSKSSGLDHHQRRVKTPQEIKAMERAFNENALTRKATEGTSRCVGCQPARVFAQRCAWISMRTHSTPRLRADASVCLHHYGSDIVKTFLQHSSTKLEEASAGDQADGKRKSIAATGGAASPMVHAHDLRANASTFAFAE